MYGGRVPLLQKPAIASSAKHAAPQDVSATGVYLKKYTTRSAIG